MLPRQCDRRDRVLPSPTGVRQDPRCEDDVDLTGVTLVDTREVPHQALCLVDVLTADRFAELLEVSGVSRDVCRNRFVLVVHPRQRMGDSREHAQ